MAWPDSSCAYEFPDDTPEGRARWQAAFDDGLESGSIVVVPTAGEGVYSLKGACPRCGHQMTQVLWTEVIGIREARPHAGAPQVRSERIEIVCSCVEPHDTRPEKRSGCGWARGWATTVVFPPTEAG